MGLWGTNRDFGGTTRAFGDTTWDFGGTTREFGGTMAPGPFKVVEKRGPQDRCPVTLANGLLFEERLNNASTAWTPNNATRNPSK